MDLVSKHTTRMADLKQHYINMFGDVFAEAQVDDIHQEAVIEAFLTSLDDWLLYHVESAQRYKLMRERVRAALGLS